jgi:hypothetical protein
VSAFPTASFKITFASWTGFGMVSGRHHEVILKEPGGGCHRIRSAMSTADGAPFTAGEFVSGTTPGTSPAHVLAEKGHYPLGIVGGEDRSDEFAEVEDDGGLFLWAA